MFGLSDGLTVQFALTAGLSSPHSENPNSLFSVVSLSSLQVLYQWVLVASSHPKPNATSTTAACIHCSCAGEMEREVHVILGPIGVNEKLSRAMADNLRNVEIEGNGVGANGGNGDVEEGVILRWSKDVRLTVFLLKLEKALRMYHSAAGLLHQHLSDSTTTCHYSSDLNG